MNKIKAARVAKGLTLVEVATRANIAASSVSRVERGRMGLRPASAKRLAAVLGLDPAEVIFMERAEPARATSANT